MSTDSISRPSSPTSTSASDAPADSPVSAGVPVPAVVSPPARRLVARIAEAARAAHTARIPF